MRPKLILTGLLLLILVALTLTVRAPLATAKPNAVCTWPNSTTGNWTDFGTWSCGVVPGPADDVNVGFGGVINLNAPATIQNLNMVGGTISGTNALTVTGLTQFTGFSANLNTHGSRLPRLFSSPTSGAIVTLADPALTADSFNAVTISNPIGSNAATILDVGPRSMDVLTLQNGNLNVTSDLTVTQVVSWTGGSLSAYGNNNSAKFTLASTAVMTISPGGGLLLPSAGQRRHDHVAWPIQPHGWPQRRVDQ